MKVKKSLTGSLISVCLFLTGCGGEIMKNKTEFDWHATESAPQHYPMQIIRGTFYYKGEDNGLYIPSGGTLYAGWGQMNSIHVTGPDKKPLPDRIEAVFFSYTEKQFYRAKFDLPYEQILYLFQQANVEDSENPYYNGIMLGVAPGGAVSVWVKGTRITEIFFGQAEKIDISPSQGFGLPFDSAAESNEYIESVLTDSLSSAELESLKKHGVPFGTWSRYRNKYKWVPSYEEGKATTDKTMPVQYLNGESYWEPTFFSDEEQNKPRPLPKALKFSVDINNESIYYIIEFEEFELMDAAEKIGADGGKIYIEFDAQLPRENMKIKVYREGNKKDYITLKKYHITPDSEFY